MRAAHRVTGVAVDHANREKDDFYPTPPEGTRALLGVEQFDGPIWEPACGDGAIVNVLREAGHDVVATDLVARGEGTARVDFLMEYQTLAPNIVTNPPFKLAAPFMRKALELADRKVAILLRLACLEGAERGDIYDNTPLARVWVFRKRLTMMRGEVKDGQAGGMLAFAWFVWDRTHTGAPVLGWLK